jgi:hypothetical protein
MIIALIESTKVSKGQYLKIHLLLHSERQAVSSALQMLASLFPLLHILYEDGLRLPFYPNQGTVHIRAEIGSKE